MALPIYAELANVLVFLLVGIGFVILNVSVLSRVLRPTVKEAEKGTPYECGEPPIGSAWVRFDFRFYTMAVIFLIFEVEVAFLYPWAVIFQDYLKPEVLGERGRGPALLLFLEMAIFVGILMVGLVYCWVKGDFDWVKGTTPPEKKKT